MTAEANRIINYEGPAVVQETGAPPRIEDLLGLSQPEPTATPDQYASIDAQSKRTLTAIDRTEGTTVLESPRIIGYLTYRKDRPFAPDTNHVRAILGDGAGNEYGFASNAQCTLQFAEQYLSEGMPIPRTGDMFNIYYYFVEEHKDIPDGVRIDASEGRVIEDEELPLPEGIVRAPHYALDYITQNGVTTECLDATDRFVDELQEIGSEAAETIGDIREGAGEILDEAEERASDARDRLRDWWNNR